MLKKKKYWLRTEQVDRILEVCKAHSYEDFLVFTLCRWSLRIGEILGHDTRSSPTRYERWKDPKRKDLGKETVSSVADLPGIYVQDLRENGIEISGKGWRTGHSLRGGYAGPQLMPLPSSIMKLLFDYSSKMRKTQKLFSLSVRTAEKRLWSYAREAEIVDWQKVSPHRLRAYFATDAKDKGKSPYQIMELMRHKNLTTTNIYVGPSTPEQILKIMETLT